MSSQSLGAALLVGAGFAGGIAGAILGRRWKNRRAESRDLIELLTYDPYAPVQVPELPDEIADKAGFLELVLATAREASRVIGIVAQLDPPSTMDPVVRLVVVAHMARLCKVFDACLTMHETGHFDVAPALNRTLIEVVINLDFLFESPEPEAAARGFVYRSTDEALKPLPYFEKRVASPADADSPSEEEMRAFTRSLRPVVRARGDVNISLARAGLPTADERVTCEDGATSDTYRRCWPGKIYERVKDRPRALALYKDWFLRYSRTAHPNWVVMQTQDLDDSDSACLLDSYSNPLNVVDPASWAVAASLWYATGIAADDQLISNLQDYLTFFVKAAGLVPFFPNMTNAEIDEMIAQAEDDEELPRPA